MTEQEEFLKDLQPKDESFLDEPLAAEPEKEEPEAEQEKRLKNRAERRREQKEKEKDEMIIAMNERIKVLSEVKKFQEEVGDDHLKEIEAIYGTDTPEHQKATDILKRALNGMSEAAVSKALEKIEERQGSETKAVREAETELDSILANVEDDYGIDMDDEAERRGYLALLEKVSPKDNDGNIIEYADSEATAELYLLRKKSSSSNGRAKELSSRSMTQSGASQPSRLQISADERALKDAGILDDWR